MILEKKIIDLNIPISIGTFLGTAIALILSFKLSHSYDRWWEARKIWGAIVNDFRTLVIQLNGFVKKNSRELTDKIAYRQIAWCYSLSQNLRNENASENINDFISEHEFKSIKNQNNIPLGLLNNHCQDLSLLYHKKFVNDYQQIQIDNTLVTLCASMGKVERIKNTDFPKTYRLTLHLFIYIFLISLSFSLTEIHSLVEIANLLERKT